MTKRTFIQEKKNAKHTNVWEWEETPELAAFIAKQTGKEVLKDRPKKNEA